MIVDDLKKEKKLNTKLLETPVSNRLKNRIANRKKQESNLMFSLAKEIK